jgi:hypothetical protein
VRPGLLVGSDFEQRQITFKNGALGNIFSEQNVDQFFETGFEPVRAFLIGVGDDRHASNLFIFRRTDGEGVNVDGQTPCQGRDAVQDAGFIFDVGD